MIKTGLIGYGRWGKIVHEKLLQISEVVFVSDTKRSYEDKLDLVDWVIVCSSNKSHYSIVRNCLYSGKNVFCEKPLTESLDQAKELFSLAKKMDVRLYVSDIQNYRDINYPVRKENFISRTKKSKADIIDILFNLTYHDVYLIYDLVKGKKISNVKVIDKKQTLNFSVYFPNIKFSFYYNITSSKKTHQINGIDLTGKDDILLKMLSEVLSENVDFGHNKTLSLFAIDFIQQLKIKIFNKVGIIGGGIFGSTAAWFLSKKGFNVDLFEKNEDIMLEASAINQYRLHSGYHYPRSKSTAISSLKGQKSFLEEYSKSVIDSKDHYYCISNKHSLTSSNSYKSFLDEVKLPYQEMDDFDLVNEEHIDLTVKVKENLFDPEVLKNLVIKKLKKYKVNLMLNTLKKVEDLNDYDFVIVATYSSINSSFNLESPDQEYQFELCEKPVFNLPKSFLNQSIVVMDGPFTCIDPVNFGGTHLVGNVVHAIHETNIGMNPIIPEKFRKYMNKGVIQNSEITKKDLFIKDLKYFFQGIDDLEYRGSMFTIRAVYPNKEHNDERPTVVDKFNNKTFVLFSGKISTCVDASHELFKKLLES